MKIESSTILLSGQHLARQSYEKRESLRVWTRPAEDRVQLSQSASQAQNAASANEADLSVSLEDEPRLQLLIQVIERFTGKKIRFVNAADLQGSGAASGDAPPPPQPDQARQAPVARAGWGAQYESLERYTEEEHTTFSAQGIVRTADGKEIAISLDLSLSRRFVAENRISVEQGDARLKDPLVVNFSGTAAQLTQTRFAFDIDADGQQDAIPFVAPGSGFLALDANGDGTINDGRELFGALSGNGFADLAVHDSDGNGWIDENDPVYQRLRIWTKTADGQDRLLALGQAGVGALYLGSAATPFSLKDGANQLQGVVRSSGLFLHEDGSAGTMQQLDLTA